MASLSSHRRILSWALVGFVGGIVYNNHHYLAALMRACTRAAEEHAWDAVCLAMAMAAILMGLLGGKTGSSNEHNYRTCDFFDHMMLGLVERHDCSTDEAHEEDDHTTCRCTDIDHLSSIASTAYEASIARTHDTNMTATSTHRSLPACNNEPSIIACRDRSFVVRCRRTHQTSAMDCNHQPSIAAQHNVCINGLFMACAFCNDVGFCNDVTEDFMACSCNVVDQTKTAGVHRAIEEDLPKLLAHTVPDSVSVDDYYGEVELGYGLQAVQEIKLGYGVQELQAQARCPSTSDQLEEDEYSANTVMECAEISRKADAFIASFREQMRREMLSDMMLCA